MKRNIYLMYAIAFLQGMVFYGPVATLYRQAQGVSVFQITVIESISLILCILLEVVWGVVADRIGYKKTMIFCCALYFISKIIFWRASGFAGFLAERILLSIVAAGMSGVDASILYLSCKKEDSQRAFGIYNSLGMAGLLAAAAVFSIFVRDDYRLSGLLTVISYGMAAVLSLALTDVSPEGSGRISKVGFRQVLSQTLSDRNLLLFLVGAAFLNETHQTVTVFLNQLQYEKCGLGNTAIGSIFIIATLLGTCGAASAWVYKADGEPGRRSRFRRDSRSFLHNIGCGADCAAVSLWDSGAAYLEQSVSALSDGNTEPEGSYRISCYCAEYPCYDTG